MQNMSQISQECIANAEFYKSQASDKVSTILELQNSLNHQKDLEEERVERLMKTFEEERQDFRNNIKEVREHFESEVMVRDAIIHKLNTEIEELNLKLHKTIQVLKIPRLNEIAMKRINFNRVHVSE